MCIVCQNVPALMTGLSGTGLMIRTCIRRARTVRDVAPSSIQVATPTQPVGMMPQAARLT